MACPTPGCGRSFSRYVDLADHCRQKHEQQSCMLCKQVFADKPSLRRHGRKEHNTVEKRKEKEKAVCPTCLQTFTSSAKWLEHQGSAHSGVLIGIPDDEDDSTEGGIDLER